MNSQLTNGEARELIAERDFLKGRNVQLSDSLDDTAAHYISILERLGFDREGNPIPKPSVTDETAPIGEPAEDSGGGDEALPEAAQDR